MRLIHKIGLVLLVLGICMLLGGLVLTITIGTFAVPVLITSSVLFNTVGITLLRHGK